MLAPNLFRRASTQSSKVQRDNHSYNHHNLYTKLPGLTICRVTISPIHKVPHPARAILADHSHVWYPKVMQRYKAIIERQHDEYKEGLWMLYTSNTMHHTKVVRGWAKRRLARAVTEALRIRGFDGRGRRLEIGDLGGIGGMGDRAERPEALVGTVDVEISKWSVGTKFVEVQRQVSLVVDKILELCGRRDGGLANAEPRIRRTTSAK